MKFLRPFSLFLFLILPSLVWAHQGSVNGIVQDKASGERLPGAVVRLNPGGFGILTDEDGRFSFRSLHAGQYEVVVSYVGYASETLSVSVLNDKSTRLEFGLTESAPEIETVQILSGAGNPVAAISGLDLLLRPTQSGMDLLRTVPGLTISQHAGGGKAEQLFLRGFDMDHGTDIALSVDGMPVNMVSHAHGQGYADLHFLIPETVRDLQFAKGTYDASAGNFATAGQIGFRTRDQLDGSMVKLEGGSFGTFRGVGMFDILGEKAAQKDHDLYLASEYRFSNGFFDLPQDFERINVFAKYRGRLSDSQTLTLSGGLFQSAWNQMGLIPERAVEQGLVSRYGALDSAQGGETGRRHLNLELRTLTDSDWLLRNRLYYIDYDFDLYSNFTFFLNDSLNGDEIRQKEKRNLLGYQFSAEKTGTFLNRRVRHRLGASLRRDVVTGLGLWESQSRVQGAPIQAGDVNELNAAIYGSEEIKLSGRLNLELGLRGDLFRFSYRDQVTAAPTSQSTVYGLFSPKLNLAFQATEDFQLNWQAGTGFHSNDSRVAVLRRGSETVPRAYGTEVSGLWRPGKNLLVQATAWSLLMDQEFVYVGDEGVVEPGGKTLRTGADLSLRLQLKDWLYADMDYTWALPRTLDGPEGENYIPLAPLHSSVGGLTAKTNYGLSASLRYRYLSDRPANEDFSLSAPGYFLLDALVEYKYRAFTLGASASNLLNSSYNEAQFEVESRLRGETIPQTDLHFIPGAPLTLNFWTAVKF